MIGGSFSTRGVDVAWPKKMAQMFVAAGPLDESAIAALHRRLAQAFPAA